MKIVLIYDTEIRPDTTGEHVHRALAAAGHEVHRHQPTRLDRETGQLAFLGYERLAEDADLYLTVDDDLGYPGPPTDRLKGLSVYWCIDTHRMDHLVGSMTRWDKIPMYDVTVVAQRDMSVRLGVPWVPLAYDPGFALEQVSPESKQYDWCFVGNIDVGRRRQVLADLLDQMPRGFAGRAAHDEMFKIYRDSHIVLNMTVGDDVNMRFFEAAGSGSPMLTNRVNNGEEELFDHLLFYDSVEELPGRLNELLRDPAELALIGHRQQASVRSRHSWTKRAEELLLAIGAAPN